MSEQLKGQLAMWSIRFRPWQCSYCRGGMFTAAESLRHCKVCRRRRELAVVHGMLAR